MEEPTIINENGKQHRPDLVLHAGDICYVVDPTVIWDKEIARLEAAYRDTDRKYQAIVPKTRPSATQSNWYRDVCGYAPA